MHPSSRKCLNWHRFSLHYDDLHRDGEALALSLKPDIHRVPGVMLVERVVQVIKVLDLFIVDARDHVAEEEPVCGLLDAPHPRPRCCSVGRNRQDCDAAYAKPVFEPPKRIDLNFETELLRVALGDDLRHDAAYGGCRHGKPDPRVNSILTEDHRVHPDEGPRRIQERPATVARIDGSVRLDHIANRNAPNTVDLTTEGADHAGCKRMVEPEGVTDGDRLLSDIEVRVLPYCYGLEKLGWNVHLEHGDVLSGLDADDFRIERLLILKRDAERASSLHNMVVRDNVPDFVPDESRAASGRNLLFVSEEVDHDARLGHEDRALRYGAKDGDRVALILCSRARTERGRRRWGEQPGLRARRRGRRWRCRSTREDSRKPHEGVQDEALGRDVAPWRRALGKHQPCLSRVRLVLFLDAKENHLSRSRSPFCNGVAATVDEHQRDRTPRPENLH